MWNSPRREGVLPAGDKRGNWIVTWFQADVLHDLNGHSVHDHLVIYTGVYDQDLACIPEAEETGAKSVPRAEETRVGVGKKEVP